MQVDYGRGSVLLLRHCDTLCTSGFVDDVMFLRNGLYGALFVFLNSKSITTKTTNQILLERLLSTIAVF